MIFVHGFGGDALGTWMLFPKMLPLDQATAGHDIYFFGYDSLHRQAAYSAADLADLLKKILRHPFEVVESAAVFTAKERDKKFRYDRVTIVAHSLGSVIARRALLDLSRDKSVRPYLKDVRLVFFAPAHMGASVIRLAAAAMGVLRLPVIPLYLQFTWPVLHDLEEGSQTLEILLNETESAYQNAVAAGEPTHHLVAEVVVHAEEDKVVIQNPFGRDPPLTRAPKTGHLGICKPTDGYLDPLKHLMPHL